MAGQRENDEVMRDVEASFEQIKHLRPTHRTVSMWSDVRACLENIRTAEFYLGYLPEKPNTRGIDHEAVQTQLQDARMLLGTLALAISEGADS
jgi:hypothetical protein